MISDRINSINTNLINSLGSSFSAAPQQQLIDAMNYLWATTFGAQSGRVDPTSPLNMQMLAKAIAGVIEINPNNDLPTINIITMLTGSPPGSPPAAGSPAVLAAAFLKNPQDPIAERAFMQSIQGGKINGNLINQWWGQEGLQTNGATHYPQTLNQPDVQALKDAIKTYLQSPSQANLTNVVNALNKVKSEIPSSNRDPYTNMLDDLLNTSIIPGLVGSYSDLAATSNNSLGSILDLYGANLSGMLGIIIDKEFKNH